jgi:dTMP kinase
MRGRFITLEGGEGAGKSTQANLLLGGKVAWSPPAETLLHFAARAEHVERTIRPALLAGTWVVCDRFYDSTMAYQGYGLGADRATIAALIGLVGVHPDLTIVLDVSEDVAVARQLRRGMDADRYERLDAFFHRRVRQGFREIAAAAPERCVVVEADGAAPVVHGAIIAALARVLDVPDGAQR